MLASGSSCPRKSAPLPPVRSWNWNCYCSRTGMRGCRVVQANSNNVEASRKPQAEAGLRNKTVNAA